MLQIDNAVLVLVDVQEKLFSAIPGSESLMRNLERMIVGAKALDIPILCTEQYPQGLGPTVAGLRQQLSGKAPISKLSFSCWGEPAFRQHLASLNRRQVVVAGIETHVCVYQTVGDLLANRFEPHIVADAVASRSPANHALGLERARGEGAVITSTEMALFELLKIASGDGFKAILKLVR